MGIKQEDKELLLKDLRARLPYKPIVHIHDIDVIDYDNYLYPDYIEKMMSYSITLKPYLRPMSSMTDKDLIEFLQINGMNLNSDELKTFRRGQTTIVSTLSSYSRHIDWLNAHHFDYRGLIEKGLAIDATGSIVSMTIKGKEYGYEDYDFVDVDYTDSYNTVDEAVEEVTDAVLNSDTRRKALKVINSFESFIEDMKQDNLKILLSYIKTNYDL